MPSKYEQVDGQKCDRSIVAMCQDCTKGAGDGRVSEADAKKVFGIIMSNSKVTRTERWTVRYCLTTFNFTEAAISFLRQHMKKEKNEDAEKEPASKKRRVSGGSYYETVDGIKVDVGIMNACRDAVAGQGDGRVSLEDAQKVFVKVADSNKITKCERWTMRYCLTEFSWTQSAQEWIVSQMATMVGGAGVEVLTGKAQKRQKTAPVQDYLALVLDALKHKKSCDVPGPDANRSMLVSMAKNALAEGSDERHAYQQSVAVMIGEVLTGSVANWEHQLALAHSGVTTAEQEKATADANLASTNGQLEAKRAQVADLKAQLQADTEAEKEGGKNLKTSQNDVAEFDAKQKEKIADKDECSSAITNDFDVMKASDQMEPSAQKAHLDNIGQVLSKASGDESLVNSLFAVLKKSSADTSSFEQMVVASAEEALKKYLGDLTFAVENGEALKAEKVNAEGAAQAAAEAAAAKKTATAEALKVAQDETKALEAAEKDAEKNLEHAKKGLEKAVETVDDEEMGLDTAREQLDACTFLCERVAAAPEPETAETAAPPAA